MTNGTSLAEHIINETGYGRPYYLSPAIFEAVKTYAKAEEEFEWLDLIQSEMRDDGMVKIWL